ncbi:tyrosine-type recombinase/integrase [Priestia filamentosa]|uniref:tyrosine-type recombinase/integrase n=1 Tax=Priestia filamentosa TaxID=1402861 RepID=UPI00398250DB
MSKQFNKYIEKDGRFNFSQAPSEAFLEAFRKVDLFPPSKKLSEHTIKGYERDIGDFISFLSSHNITLKEINVITIQDYQAFLADEYAARSARRKIGILKRLVKFGYMTGFFSFSMTDWIQNPKVPKYHYSSRSGQETKEVRELDLHTAKMIISSLDEIVLTTRSEREALKSRNRLLGYFLLTTGMRASEIINLHYTHILKQKGRYFVEFKGKGNQFRKIPLNKQLTEELMNYRKLLNYEEDILEDERPIFVAFSRNKMDKLSYDSLYKLIKKVVKHVSTKERVNQHISPHWFRHTFITNLLEQDVPLAIVKELAGHSDIAITNLYIERMNENTVEKAYDQVNFGLNEKPSF